MADTKQNMNVFIDSKEREEKKRFFHIPMVSTLQTRQEQ
jgi:hypothetical protein